MTAKRISHMHLQCHFSDPTVMENTVDRARIMNSCGVCDSRALDYVTVAGREPEPTLRDVVASNQLSRAFTIRYTYLLISFRR